MKTPDTLLGYALARARYLERIHAMACSKSITTLALSSQAGFDPAEGHNAATTMTGCLSASSITGTSPLPPATSKTGRNGSGLNGKMTS